MRTEDEVMQKLLEEYPNALETIRAAGHATAYADADAGVEADEIILVAGRWPSDIKDAKQVTCSRCEGFASLSPSSQVMLAKRLKATVILCPQCGTEAMWKRKMREETENADGSGKV